MSPFERQLNSQRLRAGLKAARARDRNGGRPSILSLSQLREAKRLLDDPEVTAREDVVKRRPADAARMCDLARLDAPAGEHVT
jgi:DNA invertase Pin-like site-specific DNA recombinase